MLKDVVDEVKTANSQTQNENSSFITLDLSDFPSRYRDVCPIGCGSRGLIFSAIDQQSLRRLAIKKLTVKQQNKPKWLRQVLREISILHRLEHQNIMKIYHVLVSTGGNSSGSSSDKQPNFNEVPSIDSLYIGMELMDTDLRNVLAKSVLSSEYIKLFTYQILRGVKYMHSANVMHRDLNPSNIFINMDTLMLKIGDFGVSRLYDSEYDHAYHLSMPLTTKYYQAPELLLHPQHYTKAIDVWALGCIFIEMFKGSPAFTGDHALEQMNFILDAIPVTKNDWQSVIESGCQDIACCASAMDYTMQENNGCPKKPLETLIPDADRAAVNLVKQLLCFDPQLRIPAEDALGHPFFVSYSNPLDEPNCFRPFRIEDELDDYSTGDLEAMLQSESYSVASSFSKSTDTNVSQAGAPEWNLLRVNSSVGLPTNGSYRHLLSLADVNPQPEALSESEARTMACDFEYGVQIHECSFNKDRMSMDFRPILPEAGCFDPYKWNNTGSSGPLPSTLLKKDTVSRHSFGKASKSNEQNQRDVTRFDTGYNSSYCSSTMTNQSYGGVHRVSNALSSTLWSFSSPDVSSDQEHLTSCATPDSASSPPFNIAMDQSSSANSPVLLEDASNETITSNRHSDVSLVHQGSSRHHHHHHTHHHHHHSHHHRHHKHKNRPSHRDGSSASNATSVQNNKPGSGDSSNEHTDGAHNPCNKSDEQVSRKRGSSKKSRSTRDKDRDNTASSPRNIVIVTKPDGEEVLESSKELSCDKGNEEVSPKDPTYDQSITKITEELSKDKNIMNEFDKKESIHEHCLNISEHSSSAFSKYVSSKNDQPMTVPLTDNHHQSGVQSKEHIPLSFFAPDTSPDVAPSCLKEFEDSSILIENQQDIKTKEFQSAADGRVELKNQNLYEFPNVSKSEAMAVIKKLWKNDLSAIPCQTEAESQRPRTWSEGCRVSGPLKSETCDSLKSEQDERKIGCTVVQKIRSQFSQFFPDGTIPFRAGCCLTSPDLSASPTVNQSENAPLNRIRHFSDDRRYVLASHSFLSAQDIKGPTSKEPSSNPPPPTCSSFDSIFPGAIKNPRTRVECPF